MTISKEELPLEEERNELGQEEIPSEDLTATLQRELEELQDKYLRSLADHENARKRLAKEKQEMMRFSVENAIADFFPAIDNLESALRCADTGSPEVKNWAMGFQMILGQLKEALHNHGILAFHSEGDRFDPLRHEAVEMIETDEVPEGTILQECAKGYKSHTRTLRPARVKVAKAKHIDVSPSEKNLQIEE